MRKFRSKLTAAMIILVVVTSFLSVLFAILTVNGKFLERPEMRHVMFGLAAGDVILLIILITMIAIGLILVMRSIMKPILELDKAVSKVTAGDYNVKVDTYNKAEAIVDLLDNFNTMVEQLRNNEYLHKDFSSNISHEFKTPIASINGFAELLLEKKDLSEADKRQYLEIIADESARLSKFASDTTLLSRLSAQQIVTDREIYDLSEQLRQCSIILSYKWLEKNQEFTAELTPVMFNGNKEMMQHLWINLMDNAIKYSPDGEKVEI